MPQRSDLSLMDMARRRNNNAMCSKFHCLVILYNSFIG